MRRLHFPPEAVTFAAAMVLCLFSFVGRLGSVDEIAVYGLAYNLAQRGALDVDVLASTAPGMRSPPFTGVGSIGPDGHFYSGKGVLASLLAIPFVKLGLALPGGDPVVAALLVSVVLTATTAAVLTRHLKRAGLGTPLAIAGGISYVAASMAWAYSKRLFTEPAAALCVVLAYHWITGLARPERAPSDVLTVGRFRIGTLSGRITVLAAGLAMGGALAASYSNVVLLPVFGVLLHLIARRSSNALVALVLFGLGLAPWAVGLAAYNAVRFGDPAQTGLSLIEWSTPYFSVPAALIRMYGLLFSPYRGFLLYNPIVLIAVAGILFLRRLPYARRTPVLVAVGGTLSFLAFFSLWSMWWGGYNWGPRFLLPILPVWVIAAAFVIDAIGRAASIYRALRWLLTAGCMAIVAVSMVISLIGALSNTFVDEGELSDRGLLGPLVKPESLAASRLLTDLGSFQAVSGFRRLQQDGAEVWWRASPPVDPALQQSLADIGERVTPDSSIILLAPARTEEVLHAYRLPVALVGLAPDQVTPENDLAARPLLARRRLFLLTDAGQTDSGNTTERWLELNAFRARNEFYDPWRVAAFGTLHGPMVSTDVPLTFGARLRAIRATLGAQTSPGGSVALTIRWERVSQSDPIAGVAWFAHLVDASGSLVAQHDALIGAGYGWGDAPTLEDRRGILVPAWATPGRYHVRVGVYGPDGKPYAATANGVRLPDDVIQLDIDLR